MIVLGSPIHVNEKFFFKTFAFVIQIELIVVQYFIHNYMGNSQGYIFI